jgi:membrane-bound lytic murein transglycosylase D
MQNPRKYGFMFRDKDLYTMPNYKTIEVDSTITNLSDFAKSHNVNYKLLKQFNPWLRAKSLPDKSRKKYILKIPINTGLMVFDNIEVELDSLK